MRRGAHPGALTLCYGELVRAQGTGYLQDSGRITFAPFLSPAAMRWHLCHCKEGEVGGGIFTYLSHKNTCAVFKAGS